MIDCTLSRLNSAASAAIAVFMTGGGHVYPLPREGVAIFRVRSVTDQMKKTTGFSGISGGMGRKGGERGHIYKKILYPVSFFRGDSPRSDLEDLADVVSQQASAERNRVLLAQDTRSHELIGQDVREDAAIHGVLGQYELQLVRVRVVTDELGLGTGALR